MRFTGRRLLVVAATTGYQTRMFAEAARRLGVECVLVTDCCRPGADPRWGQLEPVRFDRPGEAARLARKFGRGAFDGIVALGDAQAVLAAELAERIGLRFHSAAGARAAHDKHRMRRLLESAGLPVPPYRRIRLSSDARRLARLARYPCVLKPLGLSASRGVIRADNPEQFVEAFGRIRRILESAERQAPGGPGRAWLQIEDYIPGKEFALEGIVSKGRLKLLALFDKPDPLEGPYFEETIYVTPSREAPHTVARILRATEQAVAALRLVHGPVHAEMRVNEQGVWMLEVAARPIGGLCAKALRFTGGMPLEELVLRHALGENVDDLERMDPASGVMMIPIPKAGVYHGVKGTEQATRVEGIFGVEITAKPGQRLEPLPEGHSYLGFLFARGETPGQVEAALRAAHGALQFDITAALPVLHL